MPFHFNRAIVRMPGQSAIYGLRSHDRPGPTYAGLLGEQAAYILALKNAGVEVTVLPPLEAFPDSMFVEDPAFVHGDAALLLRPGTASRFDEAERLASVLQDRFGHVRRLSEGFCDGGDILMLPDRVLIGLSSRTDPQGAETVVRMLGEIGLKGQVVTPPTGCLHLKTACSLVDEDTVIATPALAQAGLFDDLNVLTVPENELGAANVLRVNDVLLASAQFPGTLDLLDQHGAKLVALDTSEIGRIDAGLSCMSLRWTSRTLQ